MQEGLFYLLKFFFTNLKFINYAFSLNINIYLINYLINKIQRQKNIFNLNIKMNNTKDLKKKHLKDLKKKVFKKKWKAKKHLKN